jgi:pimeloyl-ACP methyl ester carboxylesterase
MRRMATSVLVFVAGLLLLFVGMCALLYLRQDTFIFFPRPNDASYRQAWQGQRVEIRSGEAVLEGWWAENPRASGTRVLLYFGGNAEDVLYTAATSTPYLNARRMLFVNYRGYGGSTGRPGEKELFQDALAIYDYATGAGGARPEEIVAMGRSLGSAVATMLASERPLHAVILVTPFDSLVAVAEAHYSFMPVDALLRHRFMSIERAPQIQTPALMLAAKLDRIVPPSHAQRLFDVWGGEKQIRVLDGVGHNDIQMNPAYYDAINEFLGRH